MNLKRFAWKFILSVLKPAEAVPPDFGNIKKILVVRQHDQLGDMLCAIPLLRALRNSYPASRISLIASPVNATVMENHPCIDEVLCYDKKKYWTSPLELLNFVSLLRKSAFDLAVVPATVSLSTTSDLLALISGARIRIGADFLNGIKNPCANFHTHPVSLSWEYDQHVHQTRRNLDILRPLGISSEDLTYTLGITEEEERKAADIMKSMKKDFTHVVGLHPGAGKPDNRWKAEFFAEIANGLSKEMNSLVVITVGPMDDEPYSFIRSHLRCPYEVVYKRPLREVAALIRHFDLFITNDTGIMHVAAGTQTEVIALFGGTDPLQWAPKNPNLRYINMPNGDINSIPVGRVWREIVSILSKKPNLINKNGL